MRPFGTTIFAEMSALAIRTGAVNLGQGFPDTDGPAEMLDAATEALRGGANQYPPGPGIPALRAGRRRPPEAVLGTGRTTRTARFWSPPARPRRSRPPSWRSASPATRWSASSPTTTRTPPRSRSPGRCADRYAAPGGDGRYAFDPAALRAAFGPRTRLVLLNSPHNPTGKVFTRDELTLIAELCQEYGAYAVTDEVYEHLVYSDASTGHLPLAGLPGMRERTLRVSSAGKTFSCTGWKVGWVSGPADLVAAVLRVKQFLTFVNAAPAATGRRGGAGPAGRLLRPGSGTGSSGAGPTGRRA